MTERSRAARWAAPWAAGAALLLAAAAAHAAGDSSDAVIIDTDNNVVLVGGRVSPSKAVPENFVGVGGRVVIDQPVGDNAVGVGGNVEIRSPVGGHVRAAGGTITIDNKVGGTLSAAGGVVRLTREARVGGNAKMFGGTVTIDGVVDGDLRTSTEKLVINGTVTGDVKAAAEEIVLGPGAKVGGAFNYVSGTELRKGEGATIGGPVTHREESFKHEWQDEDSTPRRALSVVGTIFSYLALLGCGALFLAVAPIFSVEASDRVKATPAKSFGMGVLTILGTPIAAILFMITVIGIPVGILLITLLPFALLLGFVVGTLWVANYVPIVLKRPPAPTVRAAIGYYAIALAVVMLLAKVPTLGGILLLVLLVIGVGAFEVEMYRRMRSSGRTVRGGVEVVRP